MFVSQNQKSGFLCIVCCVRHYLEKKGLYKPELLLYALERRGGPSYVSSLSHWSRVGLLSCSIYHGYYLELGFSSSGQEIVSLSLDCVST